MKKQNRGVRTEVHNGKRVPVGSATSIEKIASQSLEDEALQDYDGPVAEFEGKNNLQAAIATLARDAAMGDAKARTELLDRILGKPVQRTDINSKSVTLVGFLDQLSELDEEDEIIDAKFKTEREDTFGKKTEDPGETEDGVPLLR